MSFKMVHDLPPIEHHAPLIKRLLLGLSSYSFKFSAEGLTVTGDNCPGGKRQITWDEVKRVEKKKEKGRRLLYLYNSSQQALNCITLDLNAESKRRINLELERLAPAQHPLKAFFISQ